LVSGITKICLVADDKEWEKLKLEQSHQMVLVQDAGKTEIPPNSETVIGLHPMLKSQRTKTLKRLQLLK